MRVNSITPVNIYSKHRGAKCVSGKGRENAYERHNIKQNNNDQINTTIKRDSDGRVSFKGGTPFIDMAAKFTSDNPLVAEALFAILITCGARPLTIMATAKNEEDKEKCSYQAAKSISSGLVGLAMTALIGTPIAAATKLSNKKGAFNMPPEMRERSTEIVQQGVEVLSEYTKKLIAEGKDNAFASQIGQLIEGGKINLSVFKNAGKGAEKAFESNIKEKAPDIAEKVLNAIKEQKVLNNYAKTGKNVMDKLFQPVFMPLRATITVALVPILLGLVGKKKPEKKPEQNPQTILNYNVFQSDNEKELFQSFSGVANYENK